jgi:hypothetical protein
VKVKIQTSFVASCKQKTSTLLFSGGLIAGCMALLVGADAYPFGNPFHRFSSQTSACHGHVEVVLSYGNLARLSRIVCAGFAGAHGV